ncbi:putative Methylthioribose-1-phosphate isomerase [Sclerotinia borealis F-4128]|uniref:Methylthioribose-1-phosphate isomerase n=1 Tax=Sclerotinia borealis (strain F-4128) TaxID=1432307 RepID=W9CX73_SCLBF|nr:putative Methylthioribose-1-phosphate isomerase [Sclerotinia borealis F-4128]
MAGLEAIKYGRGRLEVLDQLRLPHEFVYDNVSTCEEAFDSIKSMRAPAIAIVAALALAVELHHKKDDSKTKQETIQYINKRLDYLLGSRPTAVDLSNAIKLLKRVSQSAAETTYAKDGSAACADVRKGYIDAAEKILEDDLTNNLAIGRYGAEYLRRQQMPIGWTENDEDYSKYFTTSPPCTQGAPDQTYRKLSVLTHCNTGSLATSGHGTALGIIRSLHKMNYLDHAYCTETRPYNQGSRLTAFELVYEKIPSTLITDSMAGALFARMKESRNISAVIVGADRVARNGDTANKIGTYSLAVLAKAHNIKFIVAAPTTSIDLETASGSDIKIEDRPPHELTQITGAVVGKDGHVDVNTTARVAIAHQGINVWNPSFDVTPSMYIDAVITEKGEVVRSANGTFDFKTIMPERWAQQVEGKELSVGVNGKGQSDDGTLFQMENI